MEPIDFVGDVRDGDRPGGKAVIVYRIYHRTSCTNDSMILGSTSMTVASTDVFNQAIKGAPEAYNVTACNQPPNTSGGLFFNTSLYMPGPMTTSFNAVVNTQTWQYQTTAGVTPACGYSTLNTGNDPGFLGYWPLTPGKKVAPSPQTLAPSSPMNSGALASEIDQGGASSRADLVAAVETTEKTARTRSLSI
jgi:hypothetical protein